MWSQLSGNYAKTNLTILKASNISGKFGSLKTQMFHKSGDAYPSLKGKASELRHFGHALAYAFEFFRIVGNPIHTRIAVVLAASSRMEELLDETPDAYRLSRPMAADLVGQTEVYGDNITALRRHFASLAPPVRMFRFTPKIHLIQELALHSHFIHPRLGWCWSGEDFMHKMQKVIQSCLSSCAPHQVVSEAMAKYAAGIDFDMSVDV